MKHHHAILLAALCLVSGCATDNQNIDTAKLPPEGNPCRNMILPVTPKKEDKDVCLVEAHQAVLKSSQKVPDGVYAMMGPAVIFAFPALIASIHSTCEEQMKACLEKKGYVYPKGK